MGRHKKAASVTEIGSLVTDALRRTSLRPTIKGYVPLPHQVRFHSSERKGRLFIGGNRSGKTVGGTTEDVFWLTGQHPYWTKFPTPVFGRVVAVDFDNGVEKIILPEIAKWLPPSSLINGSWEDSYSRSLRMLTLSNNSTVEFMSYDQDTDKFAGTSRHFVHFDEEPPKHIFDECMMRLVDTGGHWWCTMTPVEDMTWTYDGLYLPGKEGTNPDIEVFEVSTSENTYINDAELQILTAGLTEEDKAARQHGKYIRHSKTIYGEHITDQTFIPSILDTEEWGRFYRDRWVHFIAMDHGYTNPTCFLFFCTNADGTKTIVYDEYYRTKTLVRDNAMAILERIAELGITPAYIVGDPAIKQTNAVTGDSIQIAYIESGLPIVAGNNDVKAGIDRVANRLKRNQLFITDRCTNLKWELNRYRWGNYASKRIAERSNLKEQPLKKDDHAMDALRYGMVSRPPLRGENDISAFDPNLIESSQAINPEIPRIDVLMAQAEEAYVDSVFGENW